MPKGKKGKKELDFLKEYLETSVVDKFFNLSKVFPDSIPSYNLDYAKEPPLRLVLGFAKDEELSDIQIEEISLFTKALNLALTNLSNKDVSSYIKDEQYKLNFESIGEGVFLPGSLAFIFKSTNNNLAYEAAQIRFKVDFEKAFNAAMEELNKKAAQAKPPEKKELVEKSILEESDNIRNFVFLADTIRSLDRSFIKITEHDGKSYKKVESGDLSLTINITDKKKFDAFKKALSYYKIKYSENNDIIIILESDARAAIKPNISDMHLPYSYYLENPDVNEVDEEMLSGFVGRFLQPTEDEMDSYRKKHPDIAEEDIPKAIIQEKLENQKEKERNRLEEERRRQQESEKRDNDEIKRILGNMKKFFPDADVRLSKDKNNIEIDFASAALRSFNLKPVHIRKSGDLIQFFNDLHRLNMVNVPGLNQILTDLKPPLSFNVIDDMELRPTENVPPDIRFLKAISINLRKPAKDDWLSSENEKSFYDKIAKYRDNLKHIKYEPLKVAASNLDPNMQLKIISEEQSEAEHDEKIRQAEINSKAEQEAKRLLAEFGVDQALQKVEENASELRAKILEVLQDKIAAQKAGENFINKLRKIEDRTAEELAKISPLKKERNLQNLPKIISEFQERLNQEKLKNPKSIERDVLDSVIQTLEEELNNLRLEEKEKIQSQQVAEKEKAKEAPTGPNLGIINRSDEQIDKIKKFFAQMFLETGLDIPMDTMVNELMSVMPLILEKVKGKDDKEIEKVKSEPFITMDFIRFRVEQYKKSSSKNYQLLAKNMLLDKVRLEAWANILEKNPAAQEGFTRIGGQQLVPIGTKMPAVLKRIGPIEGIAVRTLQIYNAKFESDPAYLETLKAQFLKEYAVVLEKYKGEIDAISPEAVQESQPELQVVSSAQITARRQECLDMIEEAQEEITNRIKENMIKLERLIQDKSNIEIQSLAQLIALDKERIEKIGALGNDLDVHPKSMSLEIGKIHGIEDISPAIYKSATNIIMNLEGELRKLEEKNLAAHKAPDKAMMGANVSHLIPKKGAEPKNKVSPIQASLGVLEFAKATLDSSAVKSIEEWLRKIIPNDPEGEVLTVESGQIKIDLFSRRMAAYKRSDKNIKELVKGLERDNNYIIQTFDLTLNHLSHLTPEQFKQIGVKLNEEELSNFKKLLESRKVVSKAMTAGSSQYESLSLVIPVSEDLNSIFSNKIFLEAFTILFNSNREMLEKSPPKPLPLPKAGDLNVKVSSKSTILPTTVRELSAADVNDIQASINKGIENISNKYHEIEMERKRAEAKQREAAEKEVSLLKRIPKEKLSAKTAEDLLSQFQQCLARGSVPELDDNQKSILKEYVNRLSDLSTIVIDANELIKNLMKDKVDKLSIQIIVAAAIKQNILLSIELGILTSVSSESQDLYERRFKSNIATKEKATHSDRMIDITSLLTNDLTLKLVLATEFRKQGFYVSISKEKYEELRHNPDLTSLLDVYDSAYDEGYIHIERITRGTERTVVGDDPKALYEQVKNNLENGVVSIFADEIHQKNLIKKYLETGSFPVITLGAYVKDDFIRNAVVNNIKLAFELGMPIEANIEAITTYKTENTPIIDVIDHRRTNEMIKILNGKEVIFKFQVAPKPESPILPVTTSVHEEPKGIVGKLQAYQRPPEQYKVEPGSDVTVLSSSIKPPLTRKNSGAVAPKPVAPSTVTVPPKAEKLHDKPVAPILTAPVSSPVKVPEPVKPAALADPAVIPASVKPAGPPASPASPTVPVSRPVKPAAPKPEAVPAPAPAKPEPVPAPLVSPPPKPPTESGLISGKPINPVLSPSPAIAPKPVTHPPAIVPASREPRRSEKEQLLDNLLSNYGKTQQEVFSNLNAQYKAKRRSKWPLLQSINISILQNVDPRRQEQILALSEVFYKLQQEKNLSYNDKALILNLALQKTMDDISEHEHFYSFKSRLHSICDDIQQGLTQIHPGLTAKQKLTESSEKLLDVYIREGADAFNDAKARGPKLTKD